MLEHAKFSIFKFDLHLKVNVIAVWGERGGERGRERERKRKGEQEKARERE